MRESPRNLTHHRLRGRECHFVFRHALGQRRNNRSPAHLQGRQPFVCDVIELDAQPAPVRHYLLHGPQVVVALPVGVDEVVVSNGPPPGLARVDIGRNTDNLTLRHDQAIGPPKRAVEKVAVVVDVVDGGEQHGVDACVGHMGSQRRLPTVVFALAERGFRLLAVFDAEDVWSGHGWTHSGQRGGVSASTFYP